MSKLATFEILQQIGEGGMAVVYKAAQPDLKRFVIIKKLKKHDPESITRFKREAFVSAALNQENIVATHDFIYENGNYMLVMEYINGMDLKTILNIISPIPPLIAAIITREIARGLEHSHARGFIHRDVKPSNVLISTEGDVKIIDFGVAKESTLSNITETGVIVGTPIYMSPEQVNGEDITNQTDIYSLGILLYEMLTGVKPYSALSNTELFSLISQGKYKSPRAYANKIPRRLTGILKKMLSKSLERRYHSVSELIFDLNHFLKWENQINIKYRLSRFMSDVKFMADQETKSEIETTFEHFIPKRKKRFSTAMLVIFAILFMLSGSYYSYQQYCRNYLGNIKFKLNVENAVLIRDGNQQYEIQNGEILISRLKNGIHNFRIQAGNGYSIFEGEFFISANNTREEKITLRDQHQQALLSISTEPGGANVTINGKYLGKSPLRRRIIPVGSHKIEMGMPGFKKWENTKTVAPNNNLHLFVELEKKKKRETGD